uniref:Uncharacterized protein n=1 Tax=Tanacetum cinerariifolium TaxID=118510 RepID=A0A6L2LGL2_TANCI|nr:hypothetical protein [Tanacetum cinerariifolium]
MEPLPKSPRLPTITPQRTPPFTVSAPPRPSPEVVEIVRCNHNKILSTFTRKLLGCVVCFKPKDMEMETKTKPEYKKDKVVAVTSFSGNLMHSPNSYSEMNHEEREEKLKSAIGYRKNSPIS